VTLTKFYRCGGFKLLPSTAMRKLLSHTCLCPGAISRGTRENAVAVVKVFKNALWSALQTIFTAKMHHIPGFCIYNLKFFPASIPSNSCALPGAWTRNQFLLGSPAFALFMFYETTTAAYPNIIKLAPVSSQRVAIALRL